MSVQQKLTMDDLHTLEAYSRMRQEFRARVIEHKKHRQIALGDHVTLQFEDRLTMQYQIQEMLRVERIFEEDGIREELEAYNPLIPDGSNWKATMLIEYPDPEERQLRLAQLTGIEHVVWVQAGDEDRVYAVADEDMDRSTEDKTSAVHFLRFELPAATVAALRSGAPLTVGIEHAGYTEMLAVGDEGVRESLLADLA